MDLTEEQNAILTHCIVDPQAWIDNAVDKVGEWAVLEKIEKNRDDYLLHKDDPDYKNRAERDAADEAARVSAQAELINQQRQALNFQAVTNDKINLLLKKGKVSEAIKLKGGL